MGRWGDDIYDSDKALDYLSTITHRLECELAYWLAPEEVASYSGWLAQVLTVIELIILLEQHRFASSVFLGSRAGKTGVQRWRDVVLGVWDDNLQEEPKQSWISANPVAALEYRQQHRPAVITMLDRLESIAYHWANLDTERGKNFSPLFPDFSLPYFSIWNWTNQHGGKGASIERFVYDLVEQLVKDIITALSPEKRDEAHAFNVEEVWVAVDLLAFICTTYDISPNVSAQVVRAWRNTTIEIDKQFSEDDEASWNETTPLNQNILAAFDRLEAVAQKHPDGW